MHLFRLLLTLLAVQPAPAPTELRMPAPLVDNTSFQFSFAQIAAAPSNFPFLEDLTCREDCPEEEEEEEEEEENEDCPRPFVRTYGSTGFDPGQDAYEINLHVENGANIVIAGRTELGVPFIAVLGPDGEVIGTKSITIDQAGGFLDMLIDEDGMLCGVGTAGAAANGGLSTYAFRIDPSTMNVLWIKNHRRQGRSFVLSELHHTPGDDFLRAAGYREDDPLSAVSNGLVARIDLASGDILSPPTTYSDLGETSFRAFDKHPGSNTYYALANIQQSAAGTPQLARLNAGGSVIFNKQYDAPEIGQAVDMAVTDSTVTILCELNGNDGFVLIQSDTDGNWLWQKNYSQEYSFSNITAVDDGFIVLAKGGFQRVGLVKIDEGGEVDWTRTVRGPVTPLTFLNLNGHVTSSEEHIILSTIGILPGVLIVKADLSGNFTSGCSFDSQPVETTYSESTTITADVPLQRGQTTFFTEDLDFGEIDLELKDICTGDCPEPEEICDNGLDDDDDGLVDCDDPDLMNNCCCLEAPELNFEVEVPGCENPSAFLISDENWARIIYSGPTSGTVDGFEPGRGVSIPLREPGTYFFEVVDSCGRSGFDTTLYFIPFLPDLDLGPDTVVCQNTTIPLRAQAGFYMYEWVDGSTEETFTAFGEGDFWVRVLDSCGRTFTDTVTMTVDPGTNIDLGEDLTICPGDTLSFSVEGFTNIQWSQSSFIDCFDCPEVRFAPTTDTLLLVSAMESEGCFSSDSLRVRIKSLVGLRDTAFLCPGDSVSFGGQTIMVAGQYYDVTDESRCPVVDTLNVIGLRDTLILTEASVCSGDSVLVFGAFEQVAGTYTNLGTRANGCDSTNQLILTVLEPVITSETISICAGDSALVFGVFERVADLYARTEPGSNSCDSTHQIVLEVNDISATALQIRPDCEGAAAGAGEVLVQSNGRPVSIRWSNGTATALNENLAAGTYSVTVTTDDGCSAETSLTITDAPTLNLTPAAAPETCPGENDGSITIPDPPSGIAYRLNDGPPQTESFFDGLAPGPYQLTAQGSFGCPQTYNLAVLAADSLLFELPPDETIGLGDSVLIAPTLLTPATATINWLTDNGFGCPNCPNLALRPEETVVVTAIATDLNGCSETRTVRIIVDKNELFYLPNAFSPNGDGVNDVFRLYPGPAVASILSFAVYDRWGGQVFLRENLNPEDALGHWDGRRINGQDPSIGVYIYTVEVRLFDGQVITRAGEVLLMR